MSNVYYKFASELNFNNVNFDGLHISVIDLKKAILHHKRLGKATDFDLLISNAQTKEEYKEDHCLIPKNTSLIIARIPINNQHKKSWEVSQTSSETPRTFAPDVNHDISKMNGTEEDKIQEMMMQSTLDYDPTNYQRVKGNQTGEVPPHYRCHKCHKPGHWIKNCPLNPPGKEYSYKQRPESKKMTGIPRSLRDNVANEPHQEPQFAVEEKREIPEELICGICKELFNDAVMVPCCGSSFCDECVRKALLESEHSECPECKEKDTSPGSLIPNRFLRKSVSDFKAESSNAMAREIPKKNEEFEFSAKIMETDEIDLNEEVKNFDMQGDEITSTLENEQLNENEGNSEKASETEEEEEEDNITVTLPSAHQQSRGAKIRDSRLRRIPSHGLESQSSVRSSQDEESESFPDNNSDTYPSRSHDNGLKRIDRYETPQNISAIGNNNDKNGNQNIYSMHGSSHNTHNEYSQQGGQVYQNQNQGMMQPMHSQPMYQQNHYGPGPNYYQPNQMRPMRFDHQGNYQQHPMRHHQMHHQQMMRPMNDNYGMRHQRPPLNSLATAISQDIQQRFGSGYIDDPLEAFNRIMREKEMRKERYRRSPQRHSPDNRRKNFMKSRKRSRSGSKSLSRSKSRSRSPSRYRRKDRRSSRDRRDDRRDYRSPQRRGANSSNRKSRSRSKYKSEGNNSSKQGGKEFDLQNDKSDRHSRDDEHVKSVKYEINHNLDEQPPPPGEESSEVHQENAETEKMESKDEKKDVTTSSDEKKMKHEKSGKSEGSHHHKKSRHHDTPEDRKSKEKKKRKKSKEHEKKKSKKDKRDKKHSKSPENESKSPKKSSPLPTEKLDEVEPSKNDEENPVNESSENVSYEIQNESVDESKNIKRSDSILDINYEGKMEEFFPQESKWDRDEDESFEKTDKSEIKTNNDEKISFETLKRAENAIFAKAIREIRPNENKKKDDSSEDSGLRSSETKKIKKSPVRASIKSRLGVKVSETSPRSRSKTPKRNVQVASKYSRSNRESPDRKRIVNSNARFAQDSRSRQRRSRSLEKRKPSRSPKRSRSRDRDGRAGQRTEMSRNSPRRNSRSRDDKNRRQTRSKSRSRDDRNRKREGSQQNRQRRQSPGTSSRRGGGDDDSKQVKPRERDASRSRDKSSKIEEKSSKPLAAEDESKKEKSSRRDADATATTSANKRTRASSSSSTSTSNSDGGDSEHKRHGKSKAKKKSQSPSTSEMNNSKRKKSKKEKKAKKKKKSKK